MNKSPTSLNKQWEIKGSAGKHFDVLDGIREVAILMVVACHAFYTNPRVQGGLQDLARKVIENLNTGVPYFLCCRGS